MGFIANAVRLTEDMGLRQLAPALKLQIFEKMAGPAEFLGWLIKHGGNVGDVKGNFLAQFATAAKQAISKIYMIDFDEGSPPGSYEPGRLGLSQSFLCDIFNITDDMGLLPYPKQGHVKGPLEKYLYNVLAFGPQEDRITPESHVQFTETVHQLAKDLVSA
ncbi:hypothetical protein A2160_01325 [Candidatus Beckwithbacteria bacterium RBG_13_42_9]|uniref:Uncharacterized protein n=1 Tax=Candidatus Beckwithbacteria bacterium RBG_13_42_9 TaxID=1797457 RepID=A0A1F5E478_9BACT|nr:MAG: hypothetical protein A2160_01325 [Candidatus Beckwithbacteria bacterium RBG_13_42_9]